MTGASKGPTSIVIAELHRLRNCTYLPSVVDSTGNLVAPFSRFRWTTDCHNRNSRIIETSGARRTLERSKKRTNLNLSQCLCPG
ncbi:hypothetical protein RB195_013554 [Necator americanus]|uniref:Uncharacterized protein n=1 Tax=Necator americanus TaxID=51031 RepID=A0ABR1DXM5_NECAM